MVHERSQRARETDTDIEREREREREVREREVTETVLPAPCTRHGNTYVVQIWSSNNPELGLKETSVLHRVVERLR